jgi:hypothetical protein
MPINVIHAEEILFRMGIFITSSGRFVFGSPVRPVLFQATRPRIVLRIRRMAIQTTSGSSFVEPVASEG